MPRWEPTQSEVDAGERVLAEAAGGSPDGYWRATVEAILVEAHEAKEAAREPFPGLSGQDAVELAA